MTVLADRPIASGPDPDGMTTSNPARRKFGRRNKYKTIAEESLLHTSLLHDDHGAPDLLLSSSHEFDDFDAIDNVPAESHV